MNRLPDQQFIQAALANITYWSRFINGHPLRRLVKEQDNLLRAVQVGLDFSETQIQAVQLINTAYPFIEGRGDWQSWMPMMEQAITVCGSGHLRVRCKLLNYWGQLLRMTQQYNIALAAHQESLEIAKMLNDTQAIIEAMFNLSEDYRRYQQPEQSQKVGEKALAKARKANIDQKWVASILNTLGLAAQDLDDYKSAQKLLIEAVKLWRLVNDNMQLGRTINNLANVYLAQKAYNKALPLYREAAALLTLTESELDKSRVQLSLGTLLFNLKEYEQAEQAFRLADTLTLQQSGNHYLLAAQAQNLGNVLVKQKRYVESLPVLQKAIAYWKCVENPIMQANSLGTLAEAVAAQADVTSADEIYQTALTLLEPFDTQFARQIKEEFMVNQRNLLSN